MQARGDNWIRIAIVGTPSVPPGAVQLVAFSGNRHGLSATDASVDIRDLEEHSPGSVTFPGGDIDPGEGLVGGDLDVGNAADEYGIREYVAYWSDGSDKIRRIESLPAGGSAAGPTPNCIGRSCNKVNFDRLRGRNGWSISRYNSGYAAHESADIILTGPGIVRFTFLDTEVNRDILSLSGARMSGRSVPVALELPAGQHNLSWVSDYAVGGRGWALEFERPR